MRPHYLLLLPFLILMAACEQINEQLGLEDPVKREARLDADGRAVGGGCRQSGRAIEDCYAIYSWLPRASVFAGWREMDAYMRENKIDTVVPQLPPVEPPGAKKRPLPPAEAADNEAEEAADGPDATKATSRKTEAVSEKMAEKAPVSEEKKTVATKPAPGR